MSLVVLERTPQFRGAQTIDVWIEIDGQAADGSGAQTFRMAQRVLTYPAGSVFVPVTDDRLGSISAVTRELSDKRGEIRGVACTITLHDHDNFLRAWLDNPYQDVVDKLPVRVWLAPEDQRRAELDPQPYFRGVIQQPSFTAPRLVTLQCEDPFSATFGEPVPFHTIPRAAWPTAPADAIGQTLTPIYGAHTDEPSADAPPTIVVEAANGMSGPSGGVYLGGFGDAGGLVPTGVAVIESGAGTLDAAEWFVAVATRVAGVQSEWAPRYFTDGVATAAVSVVTGGASAVVASCDDMGIGVAYTFFLGRHDAGGYRWIQQIETASPTATFTDSPASEADATIANITPGAALCFVSIKQYVVRRRRADGWSLVSDPILCICRGWQRNNRFTWALDAGDLEYEVFVTLASTTYYRKFPVPITQLTGGGDVYFEDDQTDTTGEAISGLRAPAGMVPGIYVGTRPDLYGRTLYWWLFAHGAIAADAIQSVYVRLADGTITRVFDVSYGLTVFAPGKTGWDQVSADANFIDIAGVRYTAVAFVLNATDPAQPGYDDALAMIQNAHSVRINVSAGVEDVGDGTGTPITALLDQRQHAYRNFVFAATAYTAGPWATTVPTFADGAPKVDEASLAAAATLAAARFSSNVGAWFFREALTGQQLEAHFNLNCHTDSFWTRAGALAVAFWWPYTIGTRRFTEALDFVADSFSFQDDRQQLETAVPFRCAWSEVGDGAADGAADFQAAGEATASAMVLAKYGRKVLSDGPIGFRMRDDATACAELAALRARRYGQPLRLAPATVAGFHALEVVPGETVYIQHREGSGQLGWRDRPVRVQSQTLDADGHVVGLVFEDFRLGADEVLQGGAFMRVGSNENGVGFRADDSYEIREQTDLLVDHDALAPGWVWRFRGWGQCEAGATMAFEIYDVAAAAVVATGDPFGTTFPADGDEDVLTVPTNTGQRYYRVRVAISGATEKDGQAHGYWEKVSGV